ncbi:Ficolin-1 [Holothuria leucospilota]|uniref:Ficolin-1 n=1 Tax=Holothuria leucospilota TaxID=206669 RepID=A0A9Q1BVL0_HOLLE|nr:Ficolin-1 [Holothuria leucospilota]
MALSPNRCMFLFVMGTCSILLDIPSIEGNSQFASGSTAEGQGSAFFFYQKPEYPRDCKEVRDSCSLSVSSGVYLIKPDGYEEPFEAYCDNDIDSGGWTVIQRRFDGGIEFNRNWDDYKKGFGFLSTEFWFGNDKLSHLTNQAVYQLRIDIILDNTTSCDVQYDSFRISDEWSGYKVSSLGIYDSACRWKNVYTSFTDCNDVYNDGSTQDGVYLIHPVGWDKSPFKVFCNMSIDGGSWTVFQRRVDGSTTFYRNWTEYKEGFGDLEHEFWLGNDKLHHITQQATYEYRVDLVLSSTAYYNKYSNFHIDDEENKYRLTDVGTRTGTRGRSLDDIQNTPFSTYDQDNDGRIYNCAEGHRSGWWHGAHYYTTSSNCYAFPSGNTNVVCSYSNHNGDYNGSNGQNMYDYNCNYKYAEMKIRRIS